MGDPADVGSSRATGPDGTMPSHRAALHDPQLSHNVLAAEVRGRPGPRVQALVAAGYRVYAINQLQVARYRERRSVSGAKSDQAEAQHGTPRSDHAQPAGGSSLDNPSVSRT